MSETPATEQTETDEPQGPRDVGAETAQLPNVHQAIADAMRRIRAVGKWGRNTERGGGYAFKRIDDFMTAAHEALSQAGVHIVPTVLTRLTNEDHLTSNGNVMRWVDLEVAFDFYGPAGDSVRVITWGEGRDASDKATNKALTAAMKYALMYALMVPTEDLQDADRHNPESGQQDGPTDEQLAEHRARQERERQAAAELRAQQIAATTASLETVARLRALVIDLADTIPDAVARREQLLVTWNEAAREGALGCTVVIPEPWQQFTQVPECTLHEFIGGAQGTNLPPSGETVEADGSAEDTDPWATPESPTPTTGEAPQ